MIYRKVPSTPLLKVQYRSTLVGHAGWTLALKHPLHSSSSSSVHAEVAVTMLVMMALMKLRAKSEYHLRYIQKYAFSFMLSTHREMAILHLELQVPQKTQEHLLLLGK